MTWTAPMTATTSGTLSAATYNIHVRDNFNEMGVAKLTAARGHIVSVGVNQVTGRYPVGSTLVGTTETTTSTTWTDLTTAGPSVTVTTGTQAFVWWSANMAHSTIDQAAVFADFAISGATTRDPAGLGTALLVDGMDGATGFIRMSHCIYLNNLTAGSNTFKMKYQVGSGGGTGSFGRRQIMVWPF